MTLHNQETDKSHILGITRKRHQFSCIDEK